MGSNISADKFEGGISTLVVCDGAGLMKADVSKRKTQV